MIVLSWLCDLCGVQMKAEPAREYVSITQQRHICGDCFKKADWKKEMKDWPTVQPKKKQP